MKIALAQLNPIIGDFEKNTANILNAIKRAKQSDAGLIVFPELAVCGYPPLDFLEFEDFIERCFNAIQKIADACVGITAIVGGPSKNPVLAGKNLFNSAFVLKDGKILSVVNKTLLPTYDVFDEYRYFEPAKHIGCIEVNGFKIALTICEDLWNEEGDPLYTTYPMDTLVKEHPVLMINIAASPFDAEHAEARKKILRKNVLKYKLPLLYVNQVGAQTELIFDGGSFVMNHNGEITTELKYFEEDISFIETDLLLKHDNAFISETTNNPDPVSNIHDALVLGIRDYFRKSGFTKAILGLSGGIDSALVTVLAAEALGNENVKAVLMPSEFSSQHSIDDSVALAEKLKIPYEIIPIKSVYHEFLNTLQPQFAGQSFNLAEENIQARIRAVLLMAMSNKFGYILLNTSNKSEAAVGYGTLYGDMCGGLSVLGDVYKTTVYQLARFINRNQEIIPDNIITKAPSAELRPNQKDSDSLPEYDILDKVLYQYIELRKSPQEIIDAGYDIKLVQRILKLVNQSENKRYQTPPILRISKKAFGLGRRIPIVGRYLS